MSIVRLILLGALLALFVLFAVSNWTLVTVSFGATLVDIRLPLVVLAAFLIGALPMYLTHRISRGSWARRLARAEAGVVAPSLPERPLPYETSPTVPTPGFG